MAKDIYFFTSIGKGKGHLHASTENRRRCSSYPFPTPQQNGWVVDNTLRPLYSRERPGVQCAGGSVGIGAGLGRTKYLDVTAIRSPDRPAHSYCVSWDWSRRGQTVQEIIVVLLDPANPAIRRLLFAPRHGLAVQQTCCSATQHHREAFRSLFVSLIHFGRFGTSALGLGYVEVEFQRHPLGDVMRTSGFLNSGTFW